MSNLFSRRPRYPGPWEKTPKKEYAVYYPQPFAPTQRPCRYPLCPPQDRARHSTWECEVLNNRCTECHYRGHYDVQCHVPQWTLPMMVRTFVDYHPYGRNTVDWENDVRCSPYPLDRIFSYSETLSKELSEKARGLYLKRYKRTPNAGLRRLCEWVDAVALDHQFHEAGEVRAWMAARKWETGRRSEGERDMEEHFKRIESDKKLEADYRLRRIIHGPNTNAQIDEEARDERDATYRRIQYDYRRAHYEEP